MIIKLAEYTIKENELEVVVEAIRNFVQAIRENEPNTIYEAYRRGDSLSFVHMMQFKDSEAETKHAKAPYTKEFVKVLYPSCEKEPVFTVLEEVM